MSIQIRQITESVGLPLFEQSGREIRLTAAGQELLRTGANWTIAGTASSRRSMPEGAEEGRLRVALVTTAKYFLPRMLGAFCQRYPDIEIELEVANRAASSSACAPTRTTLHHVLPARGTRCRRHALPRQPARCRGAGRLPPCPPARSAWPTWRPPFLLRETGSGTRKAVDRHLAANGLTLKVKLALGSNEAIRDLVASGMGLAILSRHVLGEHPEQEGLRILEVAGFPCSSRGQLSICARKSFPCRRMPS